MKRIFLFAAVTAPLVLTGGIAAAQGTKPVTSGTVVRAVSLAGPAGAPGTPAGATCDFSRDPVDGTDHLSGSSVNCGPNTTQQKINDLPLPLHFNAYCITNAPIKSARLIQASIPGNDSHCDLSGITRKKATKFFKGAFWR
jgi:rhizosphere induced protein